MNTITDKLITQAGFSNTYEHDRLVLLTKLVAKHCIETYLHGRSIYDTTRHLENEFNVTAKMIENE